MLSAMTEKKCDSVQQQTVNQEQLPYRRTEAPLAGFRMPKSVPAFAALQVRTGDSSATVRYLYLRPGVPNTESADGTGTALFVAGLGVSYDEAVLSELFSVFGSVRQVAVHANKVCSSLDNCLGSQVPVGFPDRSAIDADISPDRL